MPRKARRKPEELPDPCGRQRCRFPKQWDAISQEEWARCHAMAQLLIAGRLPRDYLQH